MQQYAFGFVMNNNLTLESDVQLILIGINAPPSKHQPPPPSDGTVM
jgi:hypothetical protein